MEEPDAVGVVGEVELGSDDFSYEVHDHGRVVSFGHVARHLEDLSRSTARQHLFEVAYVVFENRSHAGPPSGVRDEACVARFQTTTRLSKERPEDLGRGGCPAFLSP